MHFFNVGVGMTFSGGLIDMFLFGVLQGNAKTNWIWIVIVGIFYFVIYYFLFGFLIKKLNLRTPGRFDDEEVKLYNRSDVENKNKEEKKDDKSDSISEEICIGLGGKLNISDVDCCATRLRVTINDAKLVNDSKLRLTGASGVVHKGNGVQIIYGPKVSVIKSNFEEYLNSDNAIEIVDNKDNKRNQRNEIKSEKKNEDKNTKISGEEKKIKETFIIASPMTGKATKLENAKDEAFAGKMMGDGAIVIPSEPIVMAPVDGIISFIFDTKHAIGIKTDNGLDLIIHVGTDTVKLKGEGFNLYVKEGDRVKKGDNLMKLDLEFLNKNTPTMESPVICTEISDKVKVRLLSEGIIHAGEELFAIDMFE